MGCTTATISKNLIVEPYELQIYGSSQVRKAYTIGGKGADWGSTVVCRTNQADCVYFGYTIKSFGESTDFLAVKLSLTAQPVWGKTYGGTNKDVLLTAIATQDGGYLMLGQTQSLFNTPLRVISPHSPWPRPLLIKITGTGNLQWSRIICCDSQTLYEARDGSFLVLGRRHSNQGDQTDKTDIILTAVDTADKIKWSRTHASGSNYFGTIITQAHDGTIMIGGSTQMSGSDFDMFLLKLTEDGQPVWARKYELAGDQGLYGLTETTDHGWIATGPNIQGAGVKSVLAMKLTPDGDIVWSNTYNSIGYYDKPTRMISGYENSFLIVGRSDDVKSGEQSEEESKGAAILLNEDGHVITSAHIARSAALMSASKTADGEYALLGSCAGLKTQTPKMFAAFWKPTINEKNTANFSPTPVTLRTVTISGMQVHDESIEDEFIRNVDVTELQISQEQLSPNTKDATKH